MSKSKHVIFDKYQKKYDQPRTDEIFIFVFMEECPYCIDMFSEWNNFKNKTTISTITVDRNYLNDLKQKEPLLKNMSPTSYPHLELISNPSENQRNYIYQGSRTAQAFEEFYKLKKTKSKSKTKAKTKTKDKDKDKIQTVKKSSPQKVETKQSNNRRNTYQKIKVPVKKDDKASRNKKQSSDSKSSQKK